MSDGVRNRNNTATSASKSSVRSKKPDNSAFKQQRLPAWQPVLTAKSVLPVRKRFNCHSDRVLWEKMHITQSFYPFFACICSFSARNVHFWFASNSQSIFKAFCYDELTIFPYFPTKISSDFLHRRCYLHPHWLPHHRRVQRCPRSRASLHGLRSTIHLYSAPSYSRKHQ